MAHMLGYASSGMCSEIVTHERGLKGDSMPVSSSFHVLEIEGSQLLFP